MSADTFSQWFSGVPYYISIPILLFIVILFAIGLRVIIGGSE